VAPVYWFEGRSAAESQRFETDHFSSIGALIIGRRMADLGIGPWGEEPTFHAPVFVVTHRPAETIVKKGGTSYAFITQGMNGALNRAREAAGSERVLVTGVPTSPASTSRRGPLRSSAFTSYAWSWVLARDSSTTGHR
jgi:dihydrofolate reductase